MLFRSTYMNLYNITDQNIPVESNIKFDNARVIRGSCGFLVNTSEIYVWRPGNYYLGFHMFHLEPLQLAVFLNNIEITGWQIYNSGWTNTNINKVTGLRKKVTFPSISQTGKQFGAFVSVNPKVISTDAITYPTSNYTNGLQVVYVREIYASQKPLKERSVNYYFQDREFLNGMVQGHKVFSKYKEYMMQTQPTAIGINTYDVQYTNGGAVSVDVNPVDYTWFYYPGNTLLDQNYLQKQIVDEYSLSYSTPINTGFRSKFAIVNNSSHMVFIKKDADELSNFTVVFDLFTHEAIVPSDPENLEYVTDPGNVLETMQIDSSFIQSKDSANKLLKLVSHSLDNFSKDVTDRKSTRLNSSHTDISRMPSSA